jgi:hypothetical protein
MAARKKSTVKAVAKKAPAKKKASKKRVPITAQFGTTVPKPPPKKI